MEFQTHLHGCLLISIRNLRCMQTIADQPFSTAQKLTAKSQHLEGGKEISRGRPGNTEIGHASRSHQVRPISDLLLLGARSEYQQLCRGMLNLELVHDGRCITCHEEPLQMVDNHFAHAWMIEVGQIAGAPHCIFQHQDPHAPVGPREGRGGGGKWRIGCDYDQWEHTRQYT